MKFSSREDVAATPEAVFDALADIARFERMAAREGVSLRRLDERAEPGAGMTWEIEFRFRGKQRILIGDIRRFDRPERVEYGGISPNFDLLLVVSLLPLSRAHTRMHVELTLRPRSLRARVLVQAARLGRANLRRRYADQIRAFARSIEVRPAG
ncbi:SRPBCC family protein [Phaeovulum sp. NW3]|uniref:SRPBCC family protein n=1 Tax=Phaeovulum sp. NW3 TaxID=2934933 RepID=UPI0020219C7B|nr:SRPBCC family protein [Phaeovulum sp. NW3]MCL7463542.1 SRPBCC family protein [Phaeovulum sp. NW3]